MHLDIVSLQRCLKFKQLQKLCAALCAPLQHGPRTLSCVSIAFCGTLELGCTREWCNWISNDEVSRFKEVVGRDVAHLHTVASDVDVRCLIHGRIEWCLDALKDSFGFWVAAVVTSSFRSCSVTLQII